MVEPVADPALADEITTLTRHAGEVLNKHVNDHGLCAGCGKAFPCERAVLAEHNLAFYSAPVLTSQLTGACAVLPVWPI